MTANHLPKTMKLLRQMRTSPELVGFVGQRLTSSRFDRLTRLISQELGDNVTPDTVRASIGDLMGEQLTMRTWYLTAWRLAGNHTKLAAGRPATPWFRQTSDEWAAIEIEEIERVRTQYGKTGYKLHCRALTGSCCPQQLDAYWPQSFISMAKAKLGFSRRHPFRYPSRHWSDFTQMRFEGLITAELSTDVPKFSTIRVPASLKKHNRQLIDLRERKNFVCPSGYEHTCTACPVGTDRCIAAVHPRTYVKETCRHCKQEAWCDPRFSGMCVPCRRHKVDHPH